MMDKNIVDRKKKRKKRLVYALSFFMILAMVPLSGFTNVYAEKIAESEWTESMSNDGSEEESGKVVLLDDSLVEIATADDLKSLRDSVNSGNDYSGITIQLKNDIDLGNEDWTPIGTSNKITFAGTFDGQGYTISGLYINSTQSDEAAGLFGEAVGASIKNLTVRGNIVGQGYVAGGIVATISEGSSVENCTSYVNFKANITYTGGIVGQMEYYQNNIIRCKNYGCIEDEYSNYCAGGIVGNGLCWLVDSDYGEISECGNYGDISGTCYEGGIAGRIQYVNIRKCFNKGDISSFQSGSAFAAGIIGNIASDNVEISNCYNTGSISVSTTSDKQSNEPYVGGIFSGYIGNNSTGISIINCYNSGSLSKTGSWKSTSTRYGEIAPDKDLTTGLNIEPVDITESRLKLQNCYSKNQITAMSSGEAASALGDAFKPDEAGINEGNTPLLSWESVESDENLYQVNFAVTPEDADISVFSDETLTSKVDYSAGLSAGKYYYRASAPGYVTETGAFSVIGADVSVNLELQKGVAVTFTVDPSEAEFLMTDSSQQNIIPDQSACGVWSYTLNKNAVYTYTAQADGYITVSRSCQTGEEDKEIAVSLQRSCYDENADADAYVYGDASYEADGITLKKHEITAGGTYYIGDGATGVMTIDTKDAVTLVGKGMSDEALYENLFIDCSQAGVKLTLQDVGISESENVANLINFTGKNNVLSIEGGCLLDYNYGYTSQHDALIHVPEDGSLTINGSGTLYQYNCTQGAGIGGDTGEMNGEIIFAMTGEAFIKGTRQGAVIGAGANAKSSGEAPGSITFESGSYNLETNSRGAAIGGSAGSSGASSGTEVYVKGGNININCDFTGSAVGGGGYDAGNDVSGGTVYITGGSLRTYIDKNAASNEYGGYNNAAFTEGVNDAVITAQRKNADNENVYKCVFDTSELGDGPYTVLVDGKEYYSGGRHAWAYVNEALSKNEGEQITITRTQDNWIANDETNLYFYLTGEDHTITVGDRTYQAVFDTSVLDTDGNITDNKVYTEGAFTVTENGSQQESVNDKVSCTEYTAGKYLIQYTGEVPEGSAAVYNGEVMMWSQAYGTSGAWITLSDTDVSETINNEDITTDTAVKEDVSYEGDVNGNSEVNIVDVQIVYDIASGAYRDYNVATMQMWMRSDVNKDSTVSALDARRIQCIIHGIEG